LASGVNLNRNKPNWLLRGLVLFSLVIHFFIFLHVAGIYRSKALSYIELTMHEAVPVRDIPRPRHRPKPPPEARSAKPLPHELKPLPAIRPLKLEPVDRDLPETLVEKISPPQVPSAPLPAVTGWNPAPPVAAGHQYDTAQNYLEMVKNKIEREKKYPEAARIKQIEGTVTVSFTISTDGHIRQAAVAGTSGHEALDTAALNAVKAANPLPPPPARHFQGPLHLEIKIVFQLT